MAPNAEHAEQTVLIRASYVNYALICWTPTPTQYIETARLILRTVGVHDCWMVDETKIGRIERSPRPIWVLSARMSDAAAAEGGEIINLALSRADAIAIMRAIEQDRSVA